MIYDKCNDRRGRMLAMAGILMLINVAGSSSALAGWSGQVHATERGINNNPLPFQEVVDSNSGESFSLSASTDRVQSSATFASGAVHFASSGEVKPGQQISTGTSWIGPATVYAGWSQPFQITTINPDLAGKEASLKYSVRWSFGFSTEGEMIAEWSFGGNGFQLSGAGGEAYGGYDGSPQGGSAEASLVFTMPEVGQTITATPQLVAAAGGYGGYSEDGSFSVSASFGWGGLQGVFIDGTRLRPGVDFTFDAIGAPAPAGGSTWYDPAILPEPAGLSFLALGGGLLLRRRREPHSFSISGITFDC